MMNLPLCPDCRAPMYVRKAAFGEFLGCSRFPDCKGLTKIPGDPLGKKPITSSKMKIMGTNLIFDDNQKRIIYHRTGNRLVLAAAGAAKTTTGVEWLAKLLYGERGPENVLALVYGRDAGHDLRTKWCARMGLPPPLHPDTPLDKLQKQDRTVRALGERAITVHAWALAQIRAFAKGRKLVLAGTKGTPNLYIIARQACAAVRKVADKPDVVPAETDVVVPEADSAGDGDGDISPGWLVEQYGMATEALYDFSNVQALNRDYARNDRKIDDASVTLLVEMRNRINRDGILTYPDMLRIVCDWIMAGGSPADEMEPYLQYLFVDECFPADTPIMLANGESRGIGQIVSDYLAGHRVEVMSFDQRTQTQESQLVVAVKRDRTGHSLVQVTVQSPMSGKSTVSCTPDHRFFLRDGSEVPAKDLRSGMQLNSIHAEGSARRIVSTHAEVVSVQSVGFVDEVFDLSVAGTHCYYANGLLVHNCQDSNVARMKIIRFLSSKTVATLAVGDLSQSIFGWSGARPDLVVKFAPPQEWLHLPVSRRCPKRVVELANALVVGQPWFVGEPMRSLPTAAAGEVTYVRAAGWRKQLAEHVKLQAGPRNDKLMDERTKKQTVAVVARTRRELALVECALLGKGIPTRWLGDANGPWLTPYGKALRGYLALVEEAVTVSDLVSTAAARPRRKLGSGPIQKALLHAECNGRLGAPFWKHWAALADPLLVLAFNKEVVGLRALDYEKRLDAIAQLLRQHATGSADVVPAHAVEKVETIDALVAAARVLGSRIAIEASVASCMQISEKDGAVILATVHASKGLEWANVHIAACDESNFPHTRAEDVDEERRCLYVAVTRAAKTLHLYTSDKWSPFIPLSCLPIDMRREVEADAKRASAVKEDGSDGDVKPSDVKVAE